MRRAVRAATEGGCENVAVVVGGQRDLIEVELREMPAWPVHNAEWQRGPGTSIRVGLQHLLGAQSELDAVVLLACDQPFADARTIAALITAREESGKAIAASRYANTLGVPALFDRSCFKSLLALPDESGAKTLIEARAGDVAEVAFEEGAIDIDTPA
ncbi:MAG: molybdenum cofactor cytidylyltransferase, partial [Verrucomicrobiota bacterium]